jgi:hypothetical protein
MEVSEVRRRMRDVLADARKNAAARRGRRDEASRAWTEVLERVALPVIRQLVQVLKAEGHGVQVFTPVDQVRIGLDGHPDDFVEWRLDTSGEEPAVIQRVNQTRGREIVTDERVFVRGVEPISNLTEDQVLDAVARALGDVIVR